MKYSRKVAYIREEECIGCTKCIAPCPTDAILGASQLMHTVITEACVGCGLCLPPCPVDCIEMIDVAVLSLDEKKHFAQVWRHRHHQRKQRLQREKREAEEKYQQAKFLGAEALAARKQVIQEALIRVKTKKGNDELN